MNERAVSVFEPAAALAEQEQEGVAVERQEAPELPVAADDAFEVPLGSDAGPSG